MSKIWPCLQKISGSADKSDKQITRHKGQKPLTRIQIFRPIINVWWVEGWMPYLLLSAFFFYNCCSIYKCMALKAYKLNLYMEASFWTLAHWEPKLIINCLDSENMVRVKSPRFVPVSCNALWKSRSWLRTSWRPLQLWAHNGEPIFLLLLVTGKA